MSNARHPHDMWDWKPPYDRRPARPARTSTRSAVTESAMLHQMGAALDRLVNQVEQARQQVAERPTPATPAPVTVDDRPYHAMDADGWKAASAAYLSRVGGAKQSPIWRRG